MKAWQYDNVGAEGLEKALKLNVNAKELTEADLQKDQILLSVHSMCPNPVDYKIAEAGMLGKLMVKRPASPGLDFCGKVIATHSDVSSVKAGQMVFGRLEPGQVGSLSERIIATTAGCVSLPENVKVDDAASLGTTAITAYQTIAQYIKDRTNPRVFINGGSGGTGLWGIQIAKTLGAHVTTSCSGKNVQLCKEMGADEVLDYTKEDIGKALTAKGMVLDLVVDNVGTPLSLYKESDTFLKEDGHFVQIGGNPDLQTVKSAMSRKYLPAFLGGGSRAFDMPLAHNDAKEFTQLGQWLAEGKIKARIAEVYAFADAPKAYEQLKTGRTVGKLVIHVQDD